MRVSSPTGASSDLYRHCERDLRALEDVFPAQPGQCGAILGIGHDVCLDAVSRLRPHRTTKPEALSSSMRPGGFEPPTRGLEVRRSVL